MKSGFNNGVNDKARGPVKDSDPHQKITYRGLGEVIGRWAISGAIFPLWRTRTILAQAAKKAPDPFLVGGIGEVVLAEAFCAE